jgi:hypothetical protein
MVNVAVRRLCLHSQVVHLPSLTRLLMLVDERAAARILTSKDGAASENEKQGGEIWIRIHKRRHQDFDCVVGFVLVRGEASSQSEVSREM